MRSGEIEIGLLPNNTPTRVVREHLAARRFAMNSRTIDSRTSAVVRQVAHNALMAMVSFAGLAPEVSPARFDRQVDERWDYIWEDDEPCYLPVGQSALVGFELMFPEGNKIRAEVEVVLVGNDDQGYWSPQMARLERLFPVGPDRWQESSVQIISSTEGWLFKSFKSLRGAMILEGSEEERLREELLAMTVADRRQALRDGLSAGLYLWKDWLIAE
jgi:hypothetical protein